LDADERAYQVQSTRAGVSAYHEATRDGGKEKENIMRPFSSYLAFQSLDQFRATVCPRSAFKDLT
jgi:hypothetical protein